MIDNNTISQLSTQAGDKKKEPILFVGFYSPKYESLAKRCQDSLDKLGLKHAIEPIGEKGSWERNVQYLPEFINKTLYLFPHNKRLCYLDMDAVIHSEPVILNQLSCDIAVRFQDFEWRKNEALIGTLYFENTQNTRNLFKEWLEMNKLNTRGIENQWTLGTMIQTTFDLNWVNLPPEYCFVFDFMKAIYPDAKPIIEHFQASRTNK